jgi:Tfp pilus assembly protein PilF
MASFCRCRYEPHVDTLFPAVAALSTNLPDTNEAGPETLRLRGLFAQAAGDLPGADALLSAALEQAPDSSCLYAELGEIRRAAGHVAESVALLRRACHLAPDRAEYHAGLGSLLLALQLPDLALPSLQQAVALDPTLVSAHGDAAICLCAMNRYPEALTHYRAAYAAEPSNNSARYLEALALLALGDFENGWRKHESRWYASLGLEHRCHHLGPSWLGDDDLTGRTILLHAEQGLGDTIQFCRYVPLVADLGCRVLLEVHQPLVPLLAGLPDVTKIYARGDVLPPFDTHCSLMSLPRAFRTRAETIPAGVPYLAADPSRTAAWRARLGARDGRRHIALAWSGSTTVWNRSMPLTELTPLLRRDDCVFHVAQTEILPEDRCCLAAWPDLRDHSADLADFADTAALVSLMDLVVSVDTVLAHLGGALARPTWTMLPLGADYRWMTTGETSPWYPTMRLFRQPALHDWTGVVAAVDRALG